MSIRKHNKNTHRVFRIFSLVFCLFLTSCFTSDGFILDSNQITDPFNLKNEDIITFIPASSNTKMKKAVMKKIVAPASGAPLYWEQNAKGGKASQFVAVPIRGGDGRYYIFASSNTLYGILNGQPSNEPVSYDLVHLSESNEIRSCGETGGFRGEKIASDKDLFSAYFKAISSINLKDCSLLGSIQTNEDTQLGNRKLKDLHGMAFVSMSGPETYVERFDYQGKKDGIDYYHTTVLANPTGKDIGKVSARAYWYPDTQQIFWYFHVVRGGHCERWSGGFWSSVLVPDGQGWKFSKKYAPGRERKNVCIRKQFKTFGCQYVQCLEYLMDNNDPKAESFIVPLNTLD